MQTLRKHALIALGVLTLASFANIANAANPLEQINQEVDKYQQRGRERADEVDQYRHHREHGRKRHDHEGQQQSGASSSCRDERNLRSVQGNVHTSMKFLNNSNQEVRTYWLDYSGRRVFYKAIPAHGQYTQPTFQTHPWVVTDARDNCINIFVSNQPSAIAEIR
jgi:von Hippel-Lindau disease tumor supressor